MLQNIRRNAFDKPSNKELEMIVKHPGLRIKEELLPKGMTVTEAAKLLAIGRPALSNFLNGKAMLSPKMAQRLSKTFNFPLDQLMQWQADYEDALIQQTEAPATHIYAPPFLDIKANDIENWVNTCEISSRSRLSVFLRTLIHSTSEKITQIDFPGNDDSQRPGWDGWVESNEATPWIPDGNSGWEFGVNKDIKAKADDDFDKSLKAHLSDSSNITFIFVTPRRWSGKNKWVQQKKALNKWKDVRAYDASDLEQWLAQSLPAQSWLANEAKLPTQNVDSLDSVWQEWANVCNPSLNTSFFNKLIKVYEEQILDYLSKPPQKPFYIAADSKIEAMAFLSALFLDKKFISYRDNCLVFKEENVLPRLAQGSKSFIAITDNKNVEKELAQYSQQIHAFVVYPKNTLIQNFDLKIEILDSVTFIHSLEKMGCSYDEAQALAKKSGYSLTVLRRQLSKNEAVNKPEWVDCYNQVLIPFLFAGVWDSSNQYDISILEDLSNDLSYEYLEKDLQATLLLNDSPVWALSSHRGVVSKIDLLFAIAPYITKVDLEHFFKIATLVLGEDDPALDLPEDQQWQANIYDKKRKYSKYLRNSIGEMLILLAVHGNELFKSRLAFNCEEAVNKLVEELFSPLNLRVLLAQSSDFSVYAEASPKVFLSIIENDLKTDKQFLELMQPVSTNIFSSPKYTDLLWALEKLAWDKSTVARVVKILAQLSQKEINDNYRNKPFSSLLGIFRSWCPDTSIKTQERIQLLKELVRKFPDIGWRICISQFPGSLPQTAFPASKCIWRNNCGPNIVTKKDVYDFCNAAVEIALTWASYTFEQLLDLVGHIYGLTTEQQDKIWLLIEDWALNQATESEKIIMREKLRTTVLSKRAKRHSNRITFTELGEQAYEALEPKELTDKHFWLFASHWVDDSADEIENAQNMDFEEREEIISQKRVIALKEILQEKGLSGILELSLKGDCASTIGFLLRRFVFSSDEESVQLIKLALESFKKDAHINYKNIIRGLLFESNDNISLFESLSVCLDDSDKVLVYLQSPFGSQVWRLVDSLDGNYQQEYWEKIVPSYCPNINEVEEAVKYLLLANRPQTAFLYVNLILKKISPKVIFDILSAMLLPTSKDENNPPDRYRLGEAFSQISEYEMLSLEQKASLEFAYIEVLAPCGLKSENCSIKSLERYLEEHPEFFVQLISELSKRDDGEDDRSENTNKKEFRAKCFDTLGALSHIPGEDNSGKINTEKLEGWVKQVISLAENNGCRNIAEYYIGKLLGHCQNGEDGIWPCEGVRDLVEDIHSKDMIEGMYIEKRNSRGVTSRSFGDGGAQEWRIVEQYQDWRRQLAITHPFVADELLGQLAKSYQNEAEMWDNEHRLDMHL